jgi:indolepyruvate ferredoxin oxidoreductase
MLARLRRSLKPGSAHQLRAAALTEALFGDTLGANTLMLGYAWQLGLIPLSAEAIEHAIELNGVAVALNLRAFRWGRLAAIDLVAVEQVVGLAPPAAPGPESLDALIARHAADLQAYQDTAYAASYRRLAEAARAAGRRAGDREEAFARAVAVQAYRLMAYKDEYEVARLYSEPAFRAALNQTFSANKRLSIWLAPPLISRLDPATGRPKKRKFGPWIFPLLAALATCKRLRGTALDPFGYTCERRAERRLMRDYLALVKRLAANLTPARLEASTTLAQAPSDIRGFGPVKAAALDRYRVRQSALLAALAQAEEPVSPPAAQGRA